MSSVSKPEKLAESSGSPSPHPPGQDEKEKFGTLLWYGQEEKDSLTFSDEEQLLICNLGREGEDKEKRQQVGAYRFPTPWYLNEPHDLLCQKRLANIQQHNQFRDSIERLLYQYMLVVDYWGKNVLAHTFPKNAFATLVITGLRIQRIA